MNKRTLLQFISAAAVLTLAACATTPAPTTVTDTLARMPELSTVTRLLNEAGLADTLRGAGPYTVFAPSDDAFKALPAKTLADLATDKAALKSLLSYHVVPGTLTTAGVKTGPTKTLQGANVVIGAAGTFVTVDDAVVQQADVAATNGVVQVIDRVLTPPKK